MLEFWDITPYTSIGPFSLNSSQKDNREIFKSFTPINRGVEDDKRDAFINSTVFVDYDTSGLAEFIQIGEPANPTFRGVSFMGREIDDVLDDMESINFEGNWNELGNAILYDEIGLLIGISSSDKVDNVALYRQGYWAPERAEAARQALSTESRPINYDEFPENIANALKKMRLDMEERRKNKDD